MQKEQSKNNTDTIQHKNFDIKYTNIMQNPYNKTVGGKNFCTNYESFLNVRNSSAE